MRGFEKVSRIDGNKVILPKRSTSSSAGYDFFLPEDIVISSNSSIIIKTGVKVYMEPDEALFIHIRSSMGIKKGLILNNIVGIIDSDYYNNPDNEGEILLSVYNSSDDIVSLDKGTRVAQGVFQKILLTDDDRQSDDRKGGIGSTG